jgi:hypothetical protein
MTPKVKTDGHIPLITNEDFIRLQVKLIQQYQQEHNLNEEQATMEWIAKYAQSLREKWQPYIVSRKAEMYRMKEEIARHRWIESEKKGYDVGVSAELEWLENYKSGFSIEWEEPVTKEGAIR